MKMRRQKQERQQNKQSETPTRDALLLQMLQSIDNRVGRVEDKVDRLFFVIIGAGVGIIAALISLIGVLLAKG